MENLKNYIESVLLTIDGVNQFNYLIDESELDLIQDRKSGFAGLSFSNLINNNNGIEVVQTSFIFESYLDQERFTYLYQLDVLKKIIGEFKGIVLNSTSYNFDTTWTLEPFTNKSVNKTCGYFFQINIEIINQNFCKTEKI